MMILVYRGGVKQLVRGSTKLNVAKWTIIITDITLIDTYNVKVFF